MVLHTCHGLRRPPLARSFRFPTIAIVLGTRRGLTSASMCVMVYLPRTNIWVLETPDRLGGQGFSSI
jgi:hypothetical protein